MFHESMRMCATIPKLQGKYDSSLNFTSTESQKTEPHAHEKYKCGLYTPIGMKHLQTQQKNQT